MTDDNELSRSNHLVATVQNKKDPRQEIAVRYLREENAIVTSGIEVHFGEKEILIPAHLVIIDFELIGTIVAAILEELSQAHDRDSTFAYVPQFHVLDKTYSLKEHGEYMKLSVVE